MNQSTTKGKGSYKDLLNRGFKKCTLEIEKDSKKNLFSALASPKTLKECLTRKRYQKNKAKAENSYKTYLNEPLPHFLDTLKKSKDDFYKEFLNPNGDDIFCQFTLKEESVKKQKGLYSYCVDGKIVYIGRCRDNFGKRINNGYGHISPKNCYLDGQSTNCHVNSLVHKNRNKISFYVLSMTKNNEIEQEEKDLIALFDPEWNKILKLKKLNNQ